MQKIGLSVVQNRECNAEKMCTILYFLWDGLFETVQKQALRLFMLGGYREQYILETVDSGPDKIVSQFLHRGSVPAKFRALMGWAQKWSQGAKKKGAAFPAKPLFSSQSIIRLQQGTHPMH